MANQHSTISVTRQDKTIRNALRILKEQLKQPQSESLNSSSKVKDYFLMELGREEREVFCVMFLDAQNRLIDSEIMFYGTLTQTFIHPREVVKKALTHNAASVILAHNHPSGLSEPSEADILLTKSLTNALSVVDIKVLDHIIVAADKAYSFADNRTMQNAENKDFELKHIQQPIKSVSNFHNYGTGVGSYIEAFANDDKDALSSIGACVAESAFTGLATVGKLVAYGDLGEIDTRDVGWLIVMLAELGANARDHADNAAGTQHKVEVLNPV